jgi:Protein of unknown function (DUF2934)
MPYLFGKTHAIRTRQDATIRDQSSAAEAAASTARPSHDEIARLAYSYWEARGGQGGSPCEDWFDAERELMGRINPQ